MLLERRLLLTTLLFIGFRALPDIARGAPVLGEKLADSQQGHLISDLTCALPANGWTDADSNVHKPISKPPKGLWRIIVDPLSVLYVIDDADRVVLVESV